MSFVNFFYFSISYGLCLITAPTKHNSRDSKFKKQF